MGYRVFPRFNRIGRPKAVTSIPILLGHYWQLCVNTKNTQNIGLGLDNNKNYLCFYRINREMVCLAEDIKLAATTDVLIIRKRGMPWSKSINEGLVTGLN